MTAIEEFQQQAQAGLARAVEAYLDGMVKLLDITVEELAEKYELEYEPINLQYTEEMLNRDDIRLRVSQKVRLKLREGQTP